MLVKPNNWAGRPWKPSVKWREIGPNGRLKYNERTVDLRWSTFIGWRFEVNQLALLQELSSFHFGQLEVHMLVSFSLRISTEC
ncbi:uncharacterized protein [Montipora foliosa]|uniref:uncharacterized protein isoform X2 n=1 Tax=Montipora foliosa TaxID=591990 RepID=UPI0035F156C0